MNCDGGETGADSRKLYTTRHLQAIAARWDAKAADWDRSLLDAECHLNEDNSYERFLTIALNAVKARRRFFSRQGVIDAGCATGLVMTQVIRYFAWGVGVDISPEMIKKAQGKNIPNTQFVVGDCFHLIESAQKAGAVFSRGVLLSHYGNEQALELLKSGREALVDRGLLICDFLNEAGRPRYKHSPPNKTYFSAEEVHQFGRAAGFTSVRIDGEKERRVQYLLAVK
ncbi:MAG TPA: class I SAM-dependent methyltransferase [Patescibacteria group bacterium]|nr:class I SAM-dependent methyltransferase [Patescibacteria group bacterium]